jgi:hypothetical protein
VGQACTHSPQATQLLSPMGSSRSNTICAVGTAPGIADHVVDLHFAAGAHAARALDAGVQVDRHGGVAQIGRGLLAAQGFQRRAQADAHARGPFAQLAVLACRFWSFRVVDKRYQLLIQAAVWRSSFHWYLACGQVGQQHLQHQVAGSCGALAGGLHLHARV